MVIGGRAPKLHLKNYKPFNKYLEQYVQILSKHEIF